MKNIEDTQQHCELAHDDDEYPPDQIRPVALHLGTEAADVLL